MLQFFHFPSFLKIYILTSMISCLMLTSLISKSKKKCKMRCIIKRKFVARFYREEKEKERIMDGIRRGSEELNPSRLACGDAQWLTAIAAPEVFSTNICWLTITSNPGPREVNPSISLHR